MINQRTHRTNKIIIAAMLVAFCIGLGLLFSGCTATKINRSTRENEVTSDKKTEENQNKKSTLFDRSQITEENYSLRLEPIDPTKPIGQIDNPSTGEQQWRNAIPVYEKKTKQTHKDVTEEKDEAKTTKTEEKSEATTNETTKDKIKFSVPWYAFLILGFFGFATIIVLFFLWKLSKTIAPILGTVAELEKRIKTLEG